MDAFAGRNRFRLDKMARRKIFYQLAGAITGQHNSGKMRRNARKKDRPKAGQIFRLIAQGLINSKDFAIGSFGRRLRGRKGPKIAIKARARKIAVLYYSVMVNGLEYTEKGYNIMRNK